MPVGGMPVIELIIRRLRRFGLDDFIVTTGYLGDLIKAVCGDGSRWGVNIQYSNEDEPLGTIGALKLIQDQLTETFIVINGDTITDIDLGQLMRFHFEHKGIATIAGTHRTTQTELGVLETNHECSLVGFQEKPRNEYLASMGLYVFEPAILDYIPDGGPFGFDDLVHACLASEAPVYVYTHSGYWLDIGIKADLERAQEEFELIRDRVMGG
jgi:mannose-1-phosphate guanylyltransferase